MLRSFGREFGGGGMYNSFSDPILNNVTISGNRAIRTMSGIGGGIYNSSSSPLLINATISDNIVNGGLGSGIYNYNTSSRPVIKNAIIWGNEVDPIYNEGDASPVLSWSIVQGGYPDGTNIITDDPLLEPLSDNGGFTKTHAIPSDSPAYAIPESAGDGNWNDAPDKDQRGIPRATSGYRAIGSYEDAEPDIEKQNAIAVFNAAESLYTDWFYPQGEPTQEYDGYEHRMIYRYYPDKEIFLLTYDGAVYYHFMGRYHYWYTVDEWLDWME